MEALTAIILAFNEERHIARAIRSARAVAGRVVVVDSFSNDATPEIAESEGAEVFQNAWTTHAGQFQWALDNCNIGPGWILRLDSDEYLEPKLQQAIRDWCVAPEPGVNGLCLRRKIVFLGQPISHGFFYPLLILRMWRSGEGRMEQRQMDEHIVLTNPNLRTLPGDLVDDNLNDLSWWIAKHNRYATLEVAARIETLAGQADAGKGVLTGQARRKRWLKEQVYARLPSTLRAGLYFFYRYVLGRGFLDGRAGFYFHFLQACWYRTLVEAKLYELERRAVAEGLTPYELLMRDGVLDRD